MRRLALACSVIALSAPAAAQFGPARDRTPAPPPVVRSQDEPTVPLADEPVVVEDGAQEELDRVADRVSDPRTSEAVASAVGALADAVLDIRIDRIRDAVAQAGDRDYDRRDDWRGRRSERTLGDMIARDDPYFRERVREDAARAAAGAGAAVRTAQRAEPELRRIAEEFGRRIEDAIGRAAADGGR